MNPKSIGLFGGTFDPVHKGHIQTSLSIQSHFHFDAYYFLPCKMPTIKAPSFANSQQRIEMLQLAIKNYPQFQLDLREIQRPSPSHTVETLQSLRLNNQKGSISFLLGYDAFLSLPLWDQWEKIIQLANLVVIQRKPYTNQLLPEGVKKLLLEHKTEHKEQLLSKPCGNIYLFHAGDYPISSTLIREELKKNGPLGEKLVGEEVYRYIKSQGLYQ